MPHSSNIYWSLKHKIDLSMEVISKSWEILGSLIEVKIPANFSYLFDVCYSELTRIEKHYSRFRDDSFLSKLNQNLNSFQSVDDEFIYLLEKSIEFYDKTEGNFDITLKSDLDRLGYDKNYSFKEKLRPCNSIISPKDAIKIDRISNKINLACEIEFGGLGKGFALDRLSAMLDTHRVDHYFLNAGGDIFAKSKDEPDPWVVLLEHPDDPSMAIGSVIINNCAIAASASNRRKWKNNHHLLNAKTRLPSKGVKAIFVIASTGIEADSYSTAIFTAGFEEGIELSKKLPVELLLVSDQNKMYKSPYFDVTFF